MGCVRFLAPINTEHSLSLRIIMATTEDKSYLERNILNGVKEEDQRLIKLARSRFVTTSTNWSDIRKAAVQDQKFYTDQQNDDSAGRAARSRGSAPRISINMLPNFVQQVENSIRQQNIGINVHPTDEQGSEETAKILQGIVRHIEHISNAKQAYLWAAGSHGALVPGFGFIKLDTDYCTQNGELTFDQEILIRGVKDPMKILPDFNAEMPDFSDAEFWFEFEVMDKEEYEEKYSDSKLNQPSFSDWSGMGQNVGLSWLKKNQVTVAKYWYKDTTIRHFALFEDGTTGFLDEFGVEIDHNGKPKVINPDLNPKIAYSMDEREAMSAAMDEKSGPGSPSSEYPITESMVPMERLAKVTRWREVVQNEVKWIITNGCEILASGEWNDSEFPFVGVVGVDRVVDGKRDIHGIIRYSKDPQKMVNYLNSAVIRKIDASNKAPWIAAAESIPEPMRNRWETSNKESHAILYYQAYSGTQDKPLPPPQRGDAIEPAIQQLMAAAQMQNQNIKATIGIYEAGIGQSMGERQSGAAIQTLAQTGEQSNFHFSDNLVLSMKRLGCLILRLIPKIYDTARTVRIVGLDDENDLVKINQMFSENGQQKNYDIKNAGCYDVVVDTGPTFASKKAQMSESMLKFAAVDPQLMPVIADILAGNMDWDTAGTIKDRIQLLQSQTMPWLHPQDGQQQLPPQVRVMVQGLQKQLQAAQAAGQHVQGLYAQEKMKNDTNLISHQAKTQQLYIKEMFALQKQRNQIIAERQTTQDKLVLEHTKLQLDHIDTRFNHIMSLYDAQKAVDDTAASSVAASNQPGPQPQQPQAALPAPAALQPQPGQPQPGLAGVGGPIVSQ